jgi:predicted DNA-binding transcriptional regulator AlpA
MSTPDSASPKLRRTSMLPSQTYGLPSAASLMGFAYSAAYEAVKSGTFPLPVIKMGRVYKVRKRDLHELLGLDPDAPLIQPDDEDAA